MLFLLPLLLAGCFGEKGNEKMLYSPDGRLILNFSLSRSGEPLYSLTFNGKEVIGPSRMGFELGGERLAEGFSLKSDNTTTFDETWKPVWGEVKEIRNHYNALQVSLETEQGSGLDIEFRLFNDGLGFRYTFPKGENQSDSVRVVEELTEFQLTGDHTAWWIPGDYDTNEYQYSTSKVSEIDASPYLSSETSIATRNLLNVKHVATPVALRSASGIHIALHEAALVNFPALQLRTDNEAKKFSAFLVPSSDPKIKARVAKGFSTPWRTVLLSDDAAGLLTSRMILNLNEPCQIEDVSWIKPMKYVGIWWEMHIGKSSWEYYNADGKQKKEHGATTSNTKRYIDFAAKNGFNGVLVEGWNTGWEDWFGKWKEDVFDFQTPYPDYQLEELAAYSIQKGAPLIVHHETSAAATSYEKYYDAAYRLMQRLGLNAIKTGYVGRIIPRGEWHDGQWMINHYNRVLEKAASYRIMVDAHEPVRPTGLHRTWPNFMASEAARGNEFNAWSEGNPPEHETILPFTRLLGGPMDYTPGIFEIKLDKYGRPDRQVHTTVAKQLALYVTLYSPLQMAADLPENYENNPAFQFIRDVAVDWDDTRILHASIGDYLTIARKAKGSESWFLGAITDEEAREQSIRFDFLPPGKTYIATIYEDGPGADWKSNPKPVNIRSIDINSTSELKLKLAPGGGAAISIVAK